MKKRLTDEARAEIARGWLNSPLKLADHSIRKFVVLFIDNPTLEAFPDAPAGGFIFRVKFAGNNRVASFSHTEHGAQSNTESVGQGAR